jgi:hypothetical protein
MEGGAVVGCFMIGPPLIQQFLRQQYQMMTASFVVAETATLISHRIG